MGSIAMDKSGNIALGYSVSDSASVFPSIRFAGRLTSDPPGTLPQGEYTIIAGAASQTATNRWGDYSAMSMDPVDDCTFWYTNEYVPASGLWQTRIATLRFASCGAAGVPDIDLAPASFHATLPEGGSAIELLTVSNLGNASLDWHIHEAPPAVSPPPKTGPKVSDYPDSGVQTPEFPAETFAHNGGFSNSSVGDSSIEVLGACNAPSDIPWLSVAPDAGTIGPGDSSDVVEAAFDATGLIVGENAATLCVNSNDPDENPVEVPVGLHVTQTVPHPPSPVCRTNSLTRQPPLPEPPTRGPTLRMRKRRLIC